MNITGMTATKIRTLLLPGLMLVLGAGLLAQAQDDQAGHTALMPDALTWQAGPPSLPDGAEFAVLEGNPAEEGPFTLRLRLPSGYQIPPHSHPGVEHVTVVSGTFHIATGDTLDTSQGTALAAGGFVVIPIGHAHYAWASEATVIQLHGVGPWGVTYVDPADDPRNQ